MTKLIFTIAVSILIGFFIFRSFGPSVSPQQVELNVNQGELYLKDNASREGVTTTKSGLQYEVLQAGTGIEHPTPVSRVQVHYEGKLLDGSIFDSSIKRGKPITFALNQVIPGWTEGLQLMVEGEKTRFFIPAKLAYGNRKAGPIPPGSTLIFDVELLNIEK